MTPKNPAEAPREAMPFPFRWFDTLRELDDHEFRTMLDAIAAYAARGEEPRFTGIFAALWQEFRHRIDYDRRKYEAVCERNRENGRRGGRPPKTPKRSGEPAAFPAAAGNPGNPAAFPAAAGKPGKPAAFPSAAGKPGKPEGEGDGVGEGEGEVLQKVSLDTFTPKPESSGVSGNRTAEKRIRFDYEGDSRLHGISPEQMAIWQENFPALDIAEELRKATVWLDANRRKRKHDVKRFLAGWLTQAQDRASGFRAAPSPPRGDPPGGLLTGERRSWSDGERG